MLRSHTCGELRQEHSGQKVSLCGWVQRSRDKGGLLWIDLRDRYGLTQLLFDESRSDKALIEKVRKLGREYVLKVSGEVQERVAKNDKMPTGDIEVFVTEVEVLNPAVLPPFTIEDDSDGGEDLRMRYRYLDLRRGPLQRNMMLRHKVSQVTRQYLDEQAFIEVETPYLIKSTPEGARDFVVPSRMHPGEFYALPQSPQTFKQLLMVSGYDRYFQIVKCFRDEDFRADRQPEFTQIDCEMAFVEQEDILQLFEGLYKAIWKEVLDVELPDFQRMAYEDAMRLYGSDKPDLRFGMPFIELSELAQGKGFNVFDSAELVVAICVPGAAEYTRKQIDALTDFVKRPQVGAKGLVYVKCNEDGSYKSSVDKFYGQDDLKAWADKADAKAGDLLLVLSGATNSTRKQMNELRLKMGDELGLRNKKIFAPLWVLDFPLLDWDEEGQAFHAMHHPFTAPKNEDRDLLSTDPGKARANAYDMVINGWEVGGGSIRIYDRELQQEMFQVLGFSAEEAQEQFGFLMDAFQYGAPPHGGIAFGMDRTCALLGGADSIRDFMAFPKNNSGRDVMIDSPARINDEQWSELGLKPAPAEE